MLWPYDEVRLKYDPDTLEAIISTPWLQAKIHTYKEDTDELKKLEARMNSGDMSAEDLPYVSRLFSSLSHLPLCYVLPCVRPKAHDEHRIKDTSLLEGSMESVFDAVQTQGESKLPLPKIARTQWEWDVDAALEFATIEGKIDPESLLSVVKRYHALELLNSDKGNDVFAELRAISDQSFKDAMGRILRQNHYVTQKCQQALSPALETAMSARKQVEDFQREERGHDKLLERAIRSLDLDPESIPVSASTQALMLLLEYCAGRNFLAFCMAVDAFERGNFEENDPMAQLLIDRHFDRAAQFINAHKNINDHGGHENVAVSFLFAMKACDKEYACEAIRLMELLSLTMCSVSQSSFA